MTKCLISEGHGRTAVVLWGLGSFGKTQLARQFQLLHSDTYTSQIWIRPGSLRGLNENTSLSEIVLNIDEYRPASPNDGSLLLQPPSRIPFHHVKARLELETNRNWLLIVDDVQDLPEQYHINEILPNCSHGTVILTTSRNNGRLLAAVQAKSIEVGKIETDVGAQIFLDKFLGEYPSTVFSDESW